MFTHDTLDDILNGDPAVVSEAWETHKAQADEISLAFFSLRSSREVLMADLAACVRRAVVHVLDGRPSMEWLYKEQKSHLGTKIEQYVLETLQLPRRTKDYPKPLWPKLDTNLADHSLDIKCSVDRSWMIPKECIGQWCMLFSVNDATKTFSIYLCKAIEEHLSLKGNGDNKRSFNAHAVRNRFISVVENMAFDEPPCDDLDDLLGISA